MDAGQEKYDTYKDSGQSWLGQVPTSWALSRNKALFKEQTAGVGKSAKDYKLLSLTLGGVIPRDMENPKGKFPAEFDTYKKVAPDDLVFCLFDVAETPRAVGRADEAGMITGAYTILRADPSVNSRYLTYYYLSLDYDKRLGSLYTGLRNVIKIDTFMSIRTPVPDLDTQNRIVRFLDEKTAEIDAAVGKKRRLIDLLNEQKAILINRAVTKGLNPTAPMKDSGVDWIGEIPAHWEVKRNKNLFSEINQRSVDGLEQHLSMSQKLGLVPSNLVEKSLESESYEGAKLVREGDLVLNRLKAHLAVFSVAPMVGVISPDYSVFRLIHSEANPHYFERLFKTPEYLGEFNRKVKGIVVGFYRLYSDDFMSIPLVVPLHDEQRDIHDHIDGLAKAFAPLFETVEQEIATLNEFKQTLIANAVTGKIKI